MVGDDCGAHTISFRWYVRLPVILAEIVLIGDVFEGVILDLSREAEDAHMAPS